MISECGTANLCIGIDLINDSITNDVVEHRIAISMVVAHSVAPVSPRICDSKQIESSKLSVC